MCTPPPLEGGQYPTECPGLELSTEPALTGPLEEAEFRHRVPDRGPSRLFPASSCQEGEHGPSGQVPTFPIREASTPLSLNFFFF